MRRGAAKTAAVSFRAAPREFDFARLCPARLRPSIGRLELISSPIYVPIILAASATVIIRVIGSAGDGMKPYFW